jgi:hypothetical protein
MDAVMIFIGNIIGGDHRDSAQQGIAPGCFPVG